MIPYQHANTRLINLIFLKCSCLKNSTFWLAESIFDTTQLQMFTLLFGFLQSIWASKKLCWLTLMLWRSGWIMNPAICLAETIFPHTKLKIYKPSFAFLESISVHPIIKLIHPFLHEIYLIQTFCYLTGQEEHFWPHLNKNLQTVFYISWIYN